MADAGGGALDDSVQKLADFVGALANANAALEGGEDAAENLATEAEKLDAEAAEQIGGFNDELEAFAADLDRDEDEALGRLEQAAAAGQALAEARLGALAQRIETVEDSLEQRLSSDLEELEREFADLESSAFEPLAPTLETNASEIDGARADLEGAYDQLESALQAMAGEVEEARERAAGTMDATAQELEGTDGAALEAEATEAASDWSAEIPQELDADAESLVTTLEGVYRQFEADAAAAGEELVEGVAAIARERAEALTTTSGPELELAVSTTSAGTAAQTDQRFDELAAAAEAAATVVETLDPLLDGLARTKDVIPEIEQALNEL
jgi:hypothetical protein